MSCKLALDSTDSAAALLIDVRNRLNAFFNFYSTPIAKRSLTSLDLLSLKYCIQITIIH